MRVTFNPSPPTEEQHSTLLPPLHLSSHPHYKAPLTTATNPKLQDAGVTTIWLGVG